MSIARFCERCERITQDGHLWCQEKDCPAEEGYPVFSYGDYLGDLKVTKLIVVWRTAALYEALRADQKVWLKVAHAQPDCEDRLRREAAFLASIGATARRQSTGQSWRAEAHPTHLTLLAPYPTPSKRQFGEISYRGETRVYSVFQPVKGSLLSDLLLENPQVWHYEAAWVIETVAEALRPLIGRKMVHLNLAPNVVWAEIDSEGHWRPTVLDFGWMWDGRMDSGAASLEEMISRCEPAYTAPELFKGRGAAAISPACDAYSLGLVLYEMLAGRPGFERLLQGDEQVRRVVAQNRAPLPIDRPELEQAGVVKIVAKAIAPDERHANVQQLAKAISAVYGQPPPEKRPLSIRAYLLIGAVIVVLLAVALGIAYLLLQVWLGGS